MKLVGLTGGVASGKTVVRKEFEQLGAYTLDCDSIAHEIIAIGKPAYQEIVAYFGNKILNEDQSINRRKLREIISQDKEKREKLSSITHPLIYKEQTDRILEIIQQNPKAIIIIEVALLIEVKAYRGVHYVIVVYCDRNTQIKRLLARSRFSRKEAERWIDLQMPLEEKVNYADFVIDNSKDLEYTKKQVKSVYSFLINSI